ncbi:MAG: O-antigen ligase family protein [Deltaproteobacteria bacterium]|nr:O-antigen ligase family protein [Deltaproteobacteria bacterium]MBF0507739.1 O-antigen ligase family protein [Deltaproteobacteria bacterium]MBF0526904.1 O-antigen ligase family protein [Deltaproteobacteria bacterium]
MATEPQKHYFPLLLLALTICLFPIPKLIPLPLVANGNLMVAVTGLGIVLHSWLVVGRNNAGDGWLAVLVKPVLTPVGWCVSIFVLLTCGYLIYSVHHLWSTTKDPGLVAMIIKLWLVFLTGAALYYLPVLIIRSVVDLRWVVAAMASALVFYLVYIPSVIYSGWTAGTVKSLADVYQVIGIPDTLFKRILLESVGNVNTIAAIAALITSFGLGFVAYNGLRPRCLMPLITFGLFICVVMSARAAVLSILAAILTLGWLRLSTSQKGLRKKHLWLILILLIAGGGYLLPSGLNLFQAKPNLEFQGGGRLIVWKPYLKQCLHRPWGHGFGADQYKSLLLGEDRIPEMNTPLVLKHTSHNTYLSLFFEGGVLLPALYLAVMGLTLHNAYRIFKNTDSVPARSLAAATMLGLVSGLVTSFFGTHYTFPSFMGYMWLLVALGDILANLAGPRSSMPRHTEASPPICSVA